MYKFLERNRLPSVPVLGFYYDRDEFVREVSRKDRAPANSRGPGVLLLPSRAPQIRTGAAFKNTTHWPIFFKFCHLTQGAMLSTRRIKSPEYLYENWDEIVRAMSRARV